MEVKNFDIVLAGNTPNDGSEDITVPNTPAPYCRIKIEAVDNIFYAVSPIDFPIDYEVTTSCTQYASAENLGLDIPDGVGPNQQGPILSDIINIPANSVIDEVRVNVDVNHTYVGDLVMQLNHPDGNNFVTLWGRECNSDQFGDINVTFQDGASAIDCGNPTEGVYAPTAPLSGLEGLNAQGDWTLIMADFWNADTGTLNDWYIELCTTTITALSVDEFTLDGFSIYPNPNSGSFNIKFNNAISNTDVEVYDVRGRLIYNKDFNVTGNFNENVTLNSAQSGLYLVNVKNGDRKITKKIIVE